METKPKYETKKRETQVISLEKGKLPPQAVDLEEAVLGAALQVKSATAEMVEIFREEPGVFYKLAHQEIYKTLLELYKESEAIDLLTVSQKLKQRGKLELIGGEFYLIELTQKISSAAHIEFHCRIIQQMFVKRRAIQVANEIIENAYQEDTEIFELLADSQKQIDDTAEWLIRKKPGDFKNVVDKIFDHEKNQQAGVPSSLTKLQEHTNGYRPTDLIILAARPGMGKTALMLNEAKYQAMRGIPVGIFSCEMSDKDLAARMLAEYCGIDSKKITHNKTNDFEKRLMEEKRPEFEKLPIYIHDQPAISPMELKLQASKWKRENGVKMIFVDYLQLMQANGKNNTGNREQEISSISRSLKATAKELEVPVMALSQLSRAVEARGGMKRPLLSDLRESGAIEQDADMVMFLLRPEYYKIDEWDDDERTPTNGTAEIGIAKFRGGETASVLVGTNLQYMRFHDLEDFNYPPVPNYTPSADDFDEPQKPNNDEEDDLPF